MLYFSGGDYTLHNNQKSIHIVIFTGGLFPSPEKTENYWKNSLHGNPDFVIAADSGLETCLDYQKYFKGLFNFEPRKILGDFDSISDKTLLEKFADAVEKFPSDKDFTDTELAVFEAFKISASLKKTPFITLVGGDGGRIDHFLNNYYSFADKKHPDVWLCSTQAVYYLEKKPYFLEVNSETDSISFCNVLGKKGKIKTKGLEWESSLFRKSSIPSVSNRIKKEFFEKKLPVKIFPKTSGYLVIGPLDMNVRPKDR